MTPIPRSTIETWCAWIGRSEVTTGYLDPTTLARFAAATDAKLEVEQNWPALGHWAYFQAVVAADQLGSDGHPRRGGLFPPIALPRRMFAAAEIELRHSLALRATATMTSTIRDVRRREGRQGELVIVDVERLIEQSGASCVRELQSIVYRGPGERLPKVPVVPMAEQDGDALWQPGPVELFRFSAATANSHRIHYDLPYATETEGYPRLVVHGPLTAAKLFAYAQARWSRPVARYTFRALAPLFACQPVRLRLGTATGQVCALRCDGTLAMEAVAEFAI